MKALIPLLLLLLAASISCTTSTQQSEKTPQSSTFFLLCYKKDLKCQDAENEVTQARSMLLSNPKYGMIDASVVPRIRIIECFQGQMVELCKQLSHNMHELMPPRMKIVTAYDDKMQEGQVYSYTSPIKREFIMRKLMKFTIPVAVLPMENDSLEGMIEEVRKFDDIAINNNVIYTLVTDSKDVREVFDNIAQDFREKYYSFEYISPQPVNETAIYVIGNNFTRKFELTPQIDLIHQIKQAYYKGQAQDVLVWDINKHIKNRTYIESLKDKMIVIAMAGLETERFTFDFLADFRAFQQQYRYSLNKYEFVVLDLDNEEMFFFLTSFQMGRFDSPSVFAINGTADFDKKKFYRNYPTYYSGNTTFRDISENFLAGIKSGEKLPLYMTWLECYKNLVNLEHWWNNKMKGYIYAIGLTSLCFLPLIIIADCFYPLLGRGPHAKKKERAAGPHSQSSEAKKKQ